MKSLKFLIYGIGLLLVAALLLVYINHRVNKTEEAIRETIFDSFPYNQLMINQFIMHGRDFKLGKKGVEIIRNLGNPKNVEIEKIKNVHDPERIDEIHKLFYDGLYIEIYKMPETNQEFITHLSVTSDKYEMKWGLNVGSSKNNVRNVLGNPLEEEDERYVYVTKWMAPNYVYFYFRDDIVYKIDWKFYID